MPRLNRKQKRLLRQLIDADTQEQRERFARELQEDLEERLGAERFAGNTPVIDESPCPGCGYVPALEGHRDGCPDVASSD